MWRVSREGALDVGVGVGREGGAPSMGGGGVESESREWERVERRSRVWIVAPGMVANRACDHSLVCLGQ